MAKEAADEGPLEIAIAGDLTDHASDLADKLLGVPPEGECILYFDSPGGSPYAAMSLVNLIVLRGLNATGVISGECSSAALWPFAACRRRYVTPFSVALFHPMKWQSEEHVGLNEAAEWARHFAQLEGEMDVLLAQLFGIDADLVKRWSHPGRYVSGPELAEIGVAELVDMASLWPKLSASTPPSKRRKKRE